MSKFNAGQSFADGDTVTGAKLNNIAGLLDIYTGLISEQTAMAATVSTADQLLIADTDNGDSGAANRVTVQKLLNDTLTNGTFTGLNLTGNLNVTQLSTLGTINNTRGTIGILNSTTGTIQSLTSSTVNISQGSAIFTQGTIGTLNTTTGTIGTLNNTTGTIATLNSTTGTIPTLVATTLITTGTGTAAAPAIVPTGDTNTGIFFPAADTIAFSEGGAEAMRINSNGNVNIGIESVNTLRYLDITNGNTGASAGSILRLITSNVAGSGNTPVDIVKYKTGGFIISNGETDAAAFTSFNVGATERLRIDSSGNVGIGTAAPVNKLEVVGSFGRGAPVTKTADFTLADTENWLIVNKGSSCTVTLPAASSWTGREFTIKVITAHAVVSATAASIVPRIGGAAGTAILPATDGAWATLVSNGTTWEIMCGS